MGKENIEKRYDKDGIEMVVDKKEYLGNACGAIGTNCIQQIMQNKTYFYTDKIGISPVIVGMASSIVTIVDALSDIVMGRLVDRTNRPEGKCRPWLKWMIIPTPIAIMLMLLIPKQASTAVQTAWMILSGMFSSAIVLTALLLPFTAMINFMTQSMVERGKVGTVRQVAGNFLGCIFNMFWIPVTNLLGGTQRAWVICGSCVAIVTTILLIIAYKFTHERYNDTEVKDKKDTDSDISLFMSLKILVHNKYWIYMLLAQLFLSAFYIFQGMGQVYYCKWVLGNDSYTFFVNIAAFAFMVLAMLTAPKIVSRFPLRVVGLLGVAIGVGCTVVRMIFPTNAVVFVVGFGVVLYGVNLIGTVITPMTINTTELNVYNYGHRVAGMGSSTSSFATKVSMAGVTTATGIILASSGYDAMAAQQSASAIKGICAINIHYQGIMLLVIAVFFLLYDFDKKYPEILAQNNARRAKAEEENAAAGK